MKPSACWSRDVSVQQTLLGAMVRLAIATGMRRGELLGLTWEQVNLSTSTITLYRTKSGEPRAVPVNATVYETLTALQAEATRRQGPVFPWDEKGHTWRSVREPFLGGVRKGGDHRVPLA
jgi:integrase